MRMGEALGRGDPRGMAILEKWRSLQTSTDPALFGGWQEKAKDWHDRACWGRR
jgi:hypothetical protein